MPTGIVASRANALRVVEVIELLLDAGQWQPADDLYRSRCDNGAVWKHLPAARLGQRAATAFVATPSRRAACATQLGDSRLSYYMNEAGLFAMYVGDLATGGEYLSLVIRRDRDAGEIAARAVSLRNLAECLGYLGQAGPGRDATAESLACAETIGEWTELSTVHSYLGWLAALAGDTAEAERQFIAADQIQVRNYDSAHLYSLPGIWWADFLALTGRQDPARVLTLRNIAISRKNRWNEDVARSDRAMGRLALAARDTAAAGGHLVAAAAVFRDGDYLTEIAPALADLAEHARVSGDLDVAERHATEAIAIAAPRGLVPAHCAALAARARIRATRATTGYPDLLYSGRDAADAAARLAARHQLPWCELDALRAHALLDQAEGIDRGWAARVDALYARLVPYGLDPDPLATVERSVGKKGRRGRRGSED